MAKRAVISFPELEGRGRRAILRTPEEVQAEEELLESQNASNPERQSPSTPETQHADNPEIQYDSVPEVQHTGSRILYPKATYRLHPETLDAIEEAKRVLRRKYNLRISLEDIAEEAILAAHRDLMENQQTSNLVHQLSRKLERQNAGKPASRNTGT